MVVSNINGVATVTINSDSYTAWATTQAMTITIPGMKWTHDALSTLHVGSFLGTTKFTAGRMYDVEMRSGTVAYESSSSLLPMPDLVCAWNEY